MKYIDEDKKEEGDVVMEAKGDGASEEKAEAEALPFLSLPSIIQSEVPLRDIFGSTIDPFAVSSHFNVLPLHPLDEGDKSPKTDGAEKWQDNKSCLRSNIYSGPKSFLRQENN